MKAYAPNGKEITGEVVFAICTIDLDDTCFWRDADAVKKLIIKVKIKCWRSKKAKKMESLVLLKMR